MEDSSLDRSCLSSSDYDLHLAMLAFLKQQYPGLKISLHAGELTSNLVTPAELSFHITQAARKAGAHRLAHGVSLRSEPAWRALITDMAAQGAGIGEAVVVKSHPMRVFEESLSIHAHDYGGRLTPVTSSQDD